MCSGASKTAMSRRSPLSCARTDYADKYAVSIRSILTATYFSSLTSLSFLGDVFSVSCRFSDFFCLRLSPTGENTRQLNYRTSLYSNNVQRVTE